jgi:hypothetical protein
MRTPLVAGAALGILTLFAAPALACPSTLTARSCAAAGGSYLAQGPVRSCTTTATAQQTSAPYDLPPLLVDAPPAVVHYTGTAQDVSDVQTTTTRTQRGKGRITTTTGTVVLSTQRVVLTCVVDEVLSGVEVATRTVDPDVCAHPENYPVGSLFG